MRASWLTYVLTAISALTCWAAESETLVEVRDGKIVTTGKLLAEDKDRAMLMDRVGQLHDLALDSAKMKKTDTRFQPLSTMEIRNQLSREFGKSFEIGSTRHYLVLAPAGRASDYAAVFEEQFSTLQRYFKVRGFSLTDPRFPLIAVVFPSHKQFTEYARAEGSKTMANMQGYYSPRTNRVVMFEPEARPVAASATGSYLPIQSENGLPKLSPVHAALATELKETMVHEATHQIAYNIGLHSRMSQTPRWVVEGMATMFEPDGMRSSLTTGSAKQRVNLDRFIVFQNFVRTGRRPQKSLRSFIESDSLYESAALDFYAQSWALTFFLVETRPRNYSAYLKRIATRDPLTEYPAKERLADFKETISPDLDWLDVQFVKYIDGLK